MEASKEAIRSVFESFDKDHSGYLSPQEIASVAKELGQEFSAQDLKKIFVDLDTNKDNQISFDEFYTWWQYGRDNKLQNLVALQLKAMNLLSKATNKFHKINSQIIESKSSDINSHAIKIALGSPELTKSAINLKVLLGSGQSEFVSEIAKGTDISPNAPGIIIRLKATNPSESKDKLEEIVTSGLELAKAMVPNAEQFVELIKTSFSVDGEYVVFAVSVVHDIVAALMEKYIQVVELWAGSDFRVEFDAELGLNFDFNTFYEDKEKKVADIISKGLHLNVSTKFSEYLKDNYKNLLFHKAEKMAQKNESQAVKFITQYVFLILLKSLNIEILTKDLEELNSKLAPLIPIFGLLGAHTTASVLEVGKGSLPPLSMMAQDLPIIEEIVNYLKGLEGVGSISLVIPKVALNIGWKLPGAGQVLDALF